MRKLFAVLLALLVVMSNCCALSEDEWQQFTSQSGRFTILLPERASLPTEQFMQSTRKKSAAAAKRYGYEDPFVVAESVNAVIDFYCLKLSTMLDLEIWTIEQSGFTSYDMTVNPDIVRDTFVAPLLDSGYTEDDLDYGFERLGSNDCFYIRRKFNNVTQADYYIFDARDTLFNLKFLRQKPELERSIVETFTLIDPMEAYKNGQAEHFVSAYGSFEIDLPENFRAFTHKEMTERYYGFMSIILDAYQMEIFSLRPHMGYDFFVYNGFFEEQLPQKESEWTEMANYYRDRFADVLESSPDCEIVSTNGSKAIHLSFISEDTPFSIYFMPKENGIHYVIGFLSMAEEDEQLILSTFKATDNPSDHSAGKPTKRLEKKSKP